MDEPSFIPNPVNCTAPIVMIIRSSPLISAMGLQGKFPLITIRPRALDGRSPWELKNLCKRVEHQRALKEIIVKENESVLKLSNGSKFVLRGLPTIGILGIDQMYLTQQNRTTTLAEKLADRYASGLGPLHHFHATRIAGVLLTTLVFLHTTARILHGDVNSFNIVVDEPFYTIKLCGFGEASKPLDETGKIASGENNIQLGLWSSPELLTRDSPITAQTDIFSFGLTILEMLSCMPPHTFPGVQDIAVVEHEAFLDKHVADKAKLVVVATSPTHLSVPSTSKRRLKAYDGMDNGGGSAKSIKVFGIRDPTTIANDRDHLNYANIGTRPAIQNAADLGAEYNTLLCLFHMCTITDPNERPSAAQLLTGWKSIYKARTR